MSVSAHVIHPPGVISCFVASTVEAVYASTIAKHKGADRSAFRLFDDVIQLLPKKEGKVSDKSLEAIGKRNAKKFPIDFMFEMNILN